MRMTETQAANGLAGSRITPTTVPDTQAPTSAPAASKTPAPDYTASPVPATALPDAPAGTPTGSPLLTATHSPVLPPENWQQWPVIPIVSARAREIYLQGLEMGNNPNVFSVVGDCQAIPQYFMSPFDDPLRYRLGPYTELQAVIDFFKGSFAHESVAVQGGFNVASVLNPLYADRTQCLNKETPLECEYRINKPSYMIISMETWWSKRPADVYEGYLRQIVAFAIDHGVVPILSTKADNHEGDFSINYAIVRVASAYQVPLWNFWAKTQALPNAGINIEEDPVDRFHISGLGLFNDFGDKNIMFSAWPNRNLTALQALDAVWRSVTQ
jgi:hypothetical protein